MLLQQHQLFEFDGFRLNPTERLLVHDGLPVSLTPKAFDVLTVLIRRRGHLVTKKELMATVWGDSIVEDGNLVVTVSKLRKALGEDGKYIQTVSKQGYRFVGDVREENVAEEDPAGLSARADETPSRATQTQETTESGDDIPRDATFPVRKALYAAGLLLLVAVSVRIGMTRDVFHPGDSNVRSMAVLPFANVSGDPQNDYLGLGIADAIITAFGSTGQVAVRPTTAVLKYDTQLADPVAVGRELKSDAILEGRVRASNGRVQVSVRLLKVPNGGALWTGSFEEDQHRAFTSQSISDNIVRAMIEELPGTLKTGPTHRGTKSAKARQLYLQGRSSFWDQRREEGVRQSISYFRQAIAEDQDYALAYAGMADSYTRLAAFSTDPAGLTPPLAKASALRALQLGSSLAEVHTSLGFISFSCDWNWNSAEQEFKRSLSLDPSYTPTRHWYSETLAVMGRLDEALDQAQRGERAEPLSPRTQADLGWILYLSRRYDQAIQADRKAVELDPNYARARTYLALAYMQTGAFDDAIHQLEEVRRLADEHLTGTTGPELIAYAQSRLGHRSEATRVLTALTARSQNGHVVRPYSAALVCLGLDDHACALEWLERAYESRDPSLAYAKTDPFLDPVRSEPRFGDLLKRMGI